MKTTLKSEPGNKRMYYKQKRQSKKLKRFSRSISTSVRFAREVILPEDRLGTRHNCLSSSSFNKKHWEGLKLFFPSANRLIEDVPNTFLFPESANASLNERLFFPLDHLLYSWQRLERNGIERLSNCFSSITAESIRNWHERKAGEQATLSSLLLFQVSKNTYFFIFLYPPHVKTSDSSQKSKQRTLQMR